MHRVVRHQGSRRPALWCRASGESAAAARPVGSAERARAEGPHSVAPDRSHPNNIWLFGRPGGRRPTTAP